MSNGITKVAESLATLAWEQATGERQPRDRRFSFTLRPGVAVLVEVRFIAPVFDHASGAAENVTTTKIPAFEPVLTP